MVWRGAALAWNPTGVDTRDIGALPDWLAETSKSTRVSFWKGIVADPAAVRAALTEPWSTGQTQGHIIKLKLVKRQMYGRARLDLLRARLLIPSWHSARLIAEFWARGIGR